MMNRRKFTLGIVAAGVATIPTLSRHTAQHSAASTKRSITIEILGFKFVRPDEPLSPGDEITWFNRDIAPHTATADDNSWDSGRLDSGQSWTMTITKGQSTKYFCRFHPMMKAQLRIS